MFADMSGSVAATYGSDPESATERVQPVLRAMVEAVTERGGIVDRFLGDGVFALFGATEAREDDAERAVAAGLAISVAVADLGLGATVGINTGPAYVGDVGADAHHEQTAMGTTVNLAARLQAQARAGEVLVAAGTRAAARGVFDFTPRPVTIKGIGEMTAYLACARVDGRRVRGFEGRTAAIVGRDAELAELERLIEGVASGRGGVACLVAEPGLGKSRLVAEVIADARGRGVAVREGRCSEATTAGFTAFADALRDWADPDALGIGIEALVASGAIDARDAHDLTEALSGLLGHSGVGGGIDPVTFRNRVHAALTSTIAALATNAPLLLVMEDLHWADPLSMDVLQGLLPSVTGRPLAVLCAFRPEPDHACSGLPELAAACAPDQTIVLRLRELSATDTSAMAQSLVGLAPEAFAALGLERAEGNPLFIEELIGAAVDHGVLVDEGGEWVVKSVPDGTATISPTLHGIVRGRVDRLPADLRRVVHAASVIGRVFPVDLLAQLLPGVDVAAALDQLEARGLVFQDRVAPRVEYAFKHVLVQEIVYDSILRREQEPLHLAVADAIESLYSDQLDEHADRLARHLERTSEHRRAFTSFVRAGARAQAQALPETALNWLAAALDRAERAGAGAAAVAEVKEREGDVLALDGNAESARDSYKDAVALADGDGLTEARLHRKIGSAWVLRHHFDAGLDEFHLAVARLDEFPETQRDEAWRGERFDVVLEEMMLNYWRNRPEEIARLVKECGSEIERYGTTQQRGGLLRAQLMQSYRETRYAVGEQHVAMARQYAALATSELDPGRQAFQIFSLGFTLLWHRDDDEAVSALTRSLRLARRGADVVTEARVLTYLAVAERFRGNVEPVRDWSDQARALSVRIGMIEYEGAAAGNHAWVARRDGDLESARERAVEALDLWLELTLVYAMQWIARFPAIAAEHALGNDGAAADHLAALAEPTQMALPEPVASLLAEAAAAPERDAIARLLRAAEAMGYA